MCRMCQFLRACFWIPIILVAGIISNRAPLGEHGVWIKWLPWGHPKKR